jgi:hypothetical protein
MEDGIMPFTFEDFRNEAGLRIELRTFLSSPTGQLMMAVMRQRYKPYDVPNDADALVSARILSQFHGAHVALDEIELLATPRGAKDVIEADYSTGDTDHDRMPTEAEMRRPIHVPGME